MITLSIAIFTTISNLFLGLIVYLKNQKSITHKLLLLLTILISIWSIANYFSVTSINSQTILKWIRVVMLITAPFTFTLLALVKAFPHQTLSMKQPSLIFFGITAIFSIIASQTSLIFKDLIFINGQSQPVPGPGLIIYAINLIGGLTYTFYTLHNKFKNTKGIEKIQLKFLLFGIVITFTLMSLT